MDQLVIATHNKGKLAELNELLGGFNIKLFSATDFNIPEPEETGSTFHANAKLKAVHAAQIAKLPALADDSGVCVEGLSGAPGIYSARWGGENKDFEMACERIRKELEAKGIAATGANAYFICVLSLAQSDGSSVEFEGRIYGKLTFPPRGGKGFGYDPIFIPEHSSKTFAEMTAQEKNARNHRQAAFDKFKEFLLKESA